MHILVTGAGGFSGSHVVTALLGLGHRVTAVVRKSLGRMPPALQGHAGLEFVAADLSGTLNALPTELDAVVHVASRSPTPGVGTIDMVRDNAWATANLIEYARGAGVRSFVYFSSMSVYGVIAVSVVDEATPIVDPNDYGATKYLGELMLRDQGDRFRSLAIRLPGVLGAGSVRNWLTGVLDAAKAGREIAIYNPDAPFNNAAHISDIAQFVGNALERNDWFGHDFVTLAADGVTTLRAAVDIVRDATRSRSTVRESAAMGRNSFIISIRKASERYGYRPLPIERMLLQFVTENDN